MRSTRLNTSGIAAVVLAAGAAALFSGCGGGSDDGASPATGATATRAAATATRPAGDTVTPVATAGQPDPTATATTPQQPQPTVPVSDPAPAATPTQAAPPPAQPTTAPPPPPPPPPTGTTVTITARDVKFVPSSVTVPFGTRVTAIFNNDDPGVAHDLVLYDPSGAKAGATEVFNGPGIRQFTFDATTAGRYGLKCTIHRNMGGALIVE